MRDDLSLVYVTNLGSNTVSVINTPTNTVAATMPASNTPTLIANQPRWTRAYVATRTIRAKELVPTIAMPQRSREAPCELLQHSAH
jgi:YVTN family beta-propeller protein